MMLNQREEFPFWNYVDLFMFIGVLFPCTAASGIALYFLKPSIGIAMSTWVAQSLMYLLLCGWLYLLLKVRYGKGFWQSLGWTYPGHSIVLYAIAGPLLALAIGLLGAALRTPVMDTPFRKLLEGKLSLAFFGVFSVILAPLIEELVFRGFIMPLLVRSYGAVAGIILTAIPFGLLHLAEYGWLWQSAVLIGSAGAAFGWVRYKTGSTMASAALHSTYNLTMYAAILFGAQV
jgi:uncharacterized protein